jgi:hypothetical protein
MQIIPSKQLDADTLAAITAALTALLDEEQVEMQAVEAAREPAWRTAAVVGGQGLRVGRGMRAGWHAADRAGHAARWSAGMHGMFD